MPVKLFQTSPVIKIYLLAQQRQNTNNTIFNAR